jgi:uncharacterized protein (TIGR02145 family)
MKTNSLFQFFLLTCLLFLQTCKEPEKQMLVETGIVSNIKISSADVSGKILDLGEGVSAYGHCYSTEANVTIASSKTVIANTPALGGFTSQLTSLLPDKTYYIKAYCSRGGVTVYGAEISFTTLSDEKPTVTTAAVTNLILDGENAKATAGGNVTNQGGTPVKERGVCYSLSPDPNTSNDKEPIGSGTGTFSYDLTLAKGTTYYLKAYAINDGGTAYGNEVSFKTKSDPVVPTVTTAEVTSVTTTSAVCGGNVTSDGDSPITARGVCWDIDHNPDLVDLHTIDPTGTGTYVSNITGLTGNTTYYVRAYATNGIGTSYGEERSFKTGAILPSVTTAAATFITAYSATSGGEVTSDGGAAVTVRGLCWSANQNPTVSGTHQDQGSGIGNFIVNISGLTPGTTYYIRAYAVNSIGTNYGPELSFKTEPVCPTLTTATVTGIGSTTATGGGNVTSDGGATVTVKGVCWSMNHNPTTLDNKTNNGTGTGSFTSSITGLTPGTTYYVRAYGTNSAGTCYGPEVEFKTLPVPPTVTTNAVTSITYNSATSGGNVTNEGGASVTARGVCWSTSQNPTVANSKTSDGAGGGTFTSSITGLSPSTNYYVRAYATNSAGTNYGGQQPFTTPAAPYITVTSPVGTDHWVGGTTHSITWTDNIEDNVSIVIYKSGSTYRILGSSVVNNGIYTLVLPGDIEYGNDYKIRISSVTNGSIYGESSNFILSEITGTTGSVNIFGQYYLTIKIGTQWWMASNLKNNQIGAFTYISDNSTWASTTVGAYCYYGNTGSNVDVYGLLYNWYAVNSGLCCPTGWHVPSDNDWTILATYLGGTSIAGGKMKESGTSHWLSPNTGATNESGFLALPGGYRYGEAGVGSFSGLSAQTAWYSSSMNGANPIYYYIIYTSSELRRSIGTTKNYGYSVRCMRD